MPGKSDYLETKLLDGVYGGPAFSLPGTLYVALYTVAPTDAGGGTELQGGGYVRPAISNDATNFPAASAGNPSSKVNGTPFTFPTATADWSGITAWGLRDAVTNGNLLHYGNFTTTQGVSNGQGSSWAPSGIQITED